MTTRVEVSARAGGQVAVLTAERCENFVRWCRYKGQSFGRCGKSGGKVSIGNWCRYFTTEASDDPGK